MENSVRNSCFSKFSHLNRIIPRAKKTMSDSEQSTPEQAMPEQTMSEQTMSEQTMPEQTMSEQTMPEQVVLEQREMSKQTVMIKIKDGDPLLVSKHRLTQDSRKFKYLIDELNYKEIEMDDFSTDTVILFLAVLDDKKLEEIEEPMFREIHKVGVVFEVNWLKKDCRNWLGRKINSAEEDRDKVFVFEESWFIIKKWGDKEMVDKLVSTLAHKDNSTFISDYMSDIDKLEFGQIDIMLDLGGCDTKTFLKMILHNVSGHTKLSKNVKYVLENMNLVLCYELNKELYLQVVETISDMSEITNSDLRFVNKLITNTARLVDSRKEEKKGRTTALFDEKKYEELRRSCKTVTDITKAVSGDRVISIFVVIDLLLYFYCNINTPTNDEKEVFIKTLTEASVNKKIQKVTRQYLHNVISGLKYSNLEKSKQLITLLTEIEKSDEMCTNNENIIIKVHEEITVRKDKEYKDLFMFKHPLSVACTKSESKCGFILRYIKQKYNRTLQLCTDEDEYKDTGIHLHDVISTRDMYLYSTDTGTCEGKQITVAGRLRRWKDWLPHITDWKCTGSYIAYNICDYLVAKRK